MKTIINEYDWIAHPNRLRDCCDEDSKVLIDNRNKIKVLAEWRDESLAYEYHEAAVIKLNRKFYVLDTSGCSCPSPTETWYIDYGPAKLSEVNSMA